MKKTTFIGSLALLATLATSACGPNNNGGDGDTVNIYFWHTFGQTIVETLERKINQFVDLVEENEGVKVQIHLSNSGSYDDILKKINDGFAAGNIPTMAVAYPDHVAEYLNRETYAGQYVVNLQTMADNEEYGFNTQPYLGDSAGMDDFVQTYIDEGTHYAREGLYSIPFMKSSEIMFYNVEAVQLALNGNSEFTGYRPEFAGSEDQINAFLRNLTWDKFMDFCEFINANKQHISNTIEVPAYYDSDANLFISKMFQNNVPYSSVNEDGSGNVDFKDGEALQAAKDIVRELKEDFDKGLFTTKGVKGTYGSNDFTQIKSIFSIGSTGGTGYNVPASDAFTVGVVKVPYDNTPMYVSQGPTLCIMNSSTISEQENSMRVRYAWEFIKYLTNANNNVEICINGSNGYVPVRESAYETDDFMAFIEGGDIYAEASRVSFEDIDNNFIVTPVFKGSATLRDEGGSILASVFRNTKDIDTAFDDAINETLLAMS